jgi:TolB-like protein/tetratricopeptide (TPR) repeat protein
MAVPMPESSPTHAIFLSYASQDSVAAKAIYEALTAAGFEVWFDQSDLRGGDAWDQKIRRQIRECALFVPIISAHTQTRAEGYFRLEWHLAEQRTYLMAHDQLFLLPVVVDDTPDSTARVPERFRERQWTRLPGGVTPPEFAARVHNLLSGKPAPAQPDIHSSYAAPKAAPAAAREKSVAVLAFANLSDDKENEYFSDGVSEELLTVLQKIPGLRVSSRTSAFSFKGKIATAQEIGTKLGVAYIVEGSVQKSGNRVKVTARLSSVSSGEEQWSRSYTREVKDVFALQEELALAIVGELRGHLAGDEAAALIEVRAAVKGGTTNVGAYEEYLMGRHQVSQFNEESNRKAMGHFTRATELDPEYASAWAGVSHCHSWFCGYSGSVSREQFEIHLAAARATAEKALAIEPDLAAGLAAKFWIQCGYDYDWKGGMATVKRALEIAPSDTDVLLMASRIAMTTRDMGKAVELVRRAVALDPISARCRAQLALTLMVAGQYGEAKVESRRTAELNPNSIFAQSGLAMVYIHEGLYTQAEEALIGSVTTWATLWLRALASFGSGNRQLADEALNSLIAHHADVAAVQIASVYGFRGEADQAFQWLRTARLQKDPGLTSLFMSPLFNKVRGDERWRPFWSEMGFDALESHFPPA